MYLRLFRGGVRFLLVTVGVVVLTSFSIDATDTLRQSQTALSILMGTAIDSGCPVGTTQIDFAGRSVCMDVFENSVGEGCSISQPVLALQTKQNIENQSCNAVSRQGAFPWTFVTLHQAKELCTKKGMRLPSAYEWYEAALGTPDSKDCAIDIGSSVPTGSFKECYSSRGMYDMIGNVWEWVDEEVYDGVYANHILPESGYVAGIDTSGVAVSSAKSPSELYNNDYFYTDTEGVNGMLRGGFYAGGTDTGIFSTHTKIDTSFSSNGTGFRCVVDL
jgi:hypothetical protein